MITKATSPKQPSDEIGGETLSMDKLKTLVRDRSNSSLYAPPPDLNLPIPSTNKPFESSLSKLLKYNSSTNEPIVTEKSSQLDGGPVLIRRVFKRPNKPGTETSSPIQEPKKPIVGTKVEDSSSGESGSSSEDEKVSPSQAIKEIKDHSSNESSDHSSSEDEKQEVRKSTQPEHEDSSSSSTEEGAKHGKRNPKPTIDTEDYASEIEEKKKKKIITKGTLARASGPDPTSSGDERIAPKK